MLFILDPNKTQSFAAVFVRLLEELWDFILE